MTASGLTAAGRNGTVVPLASVLAAAVVLVGVAFLIWWIVRRQQQGTADARLAGRMDEIAAIESEQSTEAAAGTFGRSAAWVRDRRRVMKIEAELAQLAAGSSDGRAAHLLHALSQWRASIDAWYDDDDRDRIAHASAVLRASLAQQRR